MNQSEFHSKLPDGELMFRRLQVREELGRLPEYHLDLLRHRKEGQRPIEASKLLGQTAAVSLLLDNTKERYFHGYVTHFESGGRLNNFDLYRVVMRPWLWQLTLGSDCRVFQDMTVLEILKQVFGEYKSAGTVKERMTQAKFEKRPYTVQYRESDFDFVSRLMEEEGLYYYFKHEKTQHILQLCNSPAGHDDVAGGELLWNPVDKKDPREDIIRKWARAYTLQPLKYTSTDFAAEAPATSLMGSDERESLYNEGNPLEVYDYPGGQDDYAMGTNTSAKPKLAAALAALQVKRFQSRHSVATALTPYRSLAVGDTFTFSGHADKGAYLVTSAIAEMDFAGYEASDDGRTADYHCRFNAVPKSVPFQPEARIAAPRITGPQTATVVGPKADEIHVDKYGRVKLQFHWDREGQRDEKSSCWVRVSHPWASKGFGMVSLPRIGDEVVVEFLDGNPDRPIVTGRVYNGTNVHPWELPAQATVSGIRTRTSKEGSEKTFNELRFDDKKGAEYIWFQAEGDYHQLVKKDYKLSITQSAWTAITKDRHIQVGGLMNLKVTQSATLDIGKDVTAKIGGDVLITQTGALGMDITGKVDIKTPQAVSLTTNNKLEVKADLGAALTSTASISIKGLDLSVEASARISLKCGGSFVTIGPEGVSISGPLVLINSGGSASPAQAAQAASPAKAKEVKAQEEHKDPLAAAAGAK